MIKVRINFFIFDDSNALIENLVMNTRTTPNRLLDHGFANKNMLLIKRKKFVAVMRVDGYFLSVFSRIIKISEFYSEVVTKNLFESLKCVPNDCDVNIKFLLVKPKLEILDYAWNERIADMISKRLQLEYAMSWLSTLGGAFSALGDSFETYALVAGKISVQQFKIACQLDEPLLVARCKLYMALSLIQLGKLSIAKKVVENEYKLAKRFKDTKLENMCRGVWAKLQYVYKQKSKI